MVQGVARVVSGDRATVLRLRINGDAEPSREREPPAVDRLRTEHEAELRHRRAHVVVRRVAVEVQLGVAEMSLQEVAAKGPPLDPNGELAVDAPAARRDGVISVLTRVDEDVVRPDG